MSRNFTNRLVFAVRFFSRAYQLSVFANNVTSEAELFKCQKKIPLASLPHLARIRNIIVLQKLRNKVIFVCNNVSFCQTSSAMRHQITSDKIKIKCLTPTIPCSLLTDDKENLPLHIIQSQPSHFLPAQPRISSVARTSG